MLRGFAATRAVPMDPELGFGSANSLPGRRSHVQRRLDGGSSQVTEHNGNATASIGRLMLAFCLVLLVLGVLPASFVFWACIMLLIFSCLRLRVQAYSNMRWANQEDGAALTDPQDQLLGPGFSVSTGPVIRVLPGGGGLLVLHSEPQAALQRINMQLRQLEDDAEGLAAFDPSMLRFGHQIAVGADTGVRPPPISDADIATLPCFPYKLPRGATKPTTDPVEPTTPGAGPVPVGTATPSLSLPTSSLAAVTASQPEIPGGPTSPQASVPFSNSMPHGARGAAAQGVSQAQQHGARRTGSGSGSGSSCGQTGAACVVPGGAEGCGVQGGGGGGRCGEGVSGGTCGEAAVNGLVCAVCLDPVAEGAIVMTLPCLHQFHAACVTPWLRQQGVYASCPMCKTPVFR